MAERFLLRRLVLTGPLLLLLAAVSGCGEKLSKVEVDQLEIRTFAGPVYISDMAAANAIAASVVEMIRGVESVEEIEDAAAKSGSSPFVRLTLLNDAAAGNHKVLYSLLLFGPDASGDGSSLVHFRSRSEEKLHRGRVSADATAKVVEKIEAAAKMNLAPILKMSAAQLSAVQRSIMALASAAQADADEIEFVSVEDVEWPTPALGWPKPGTVTAQVITPGQKVMLKLPDGRAVECHAAADQAVVQPDLDKLKPTTAGDSRP